MNFRKGSTQKKRRRPRKWPRWAGLVVCVLLMVVWIGSGWGTFKIATPCDPPQVQYILWVKHGCVLIEAINYRKYLSNEGGIHFSSGKLTMLLWHFRGTYYLPNSKYPIGFPLWLPLLLIAAQTGWWWWRDRASRWEGRCQRCRYLLMGLTAQKCPECGTEVSSE